MLIVDDQLARQQAARLGLTFIGFLRTVLDNASFVLGNQAEGAAAKAAAHDVHRETDHFVGGDAFALIRRMWQACVGQPEHVIHFRRGQRDRWRVYPHIHRAVFLHQCAGIAGVGSQMQHAVGVGGGSRSCRAALVDPATS